MYENFNFNPTIVHSDFEKSLYTAIKENIYFKDKVIHTKCLFHFSQMIHKNLQKSGFSKKKLNKRSLEILRNLELIYILFIFLNIFKLIF